MDRGYEIFNNSCAESCKVSITDVPECFICRDTEQAGQEPLRKFCDCTNLPAHHHCLLTWIRKGLGSEDRTKCSVCNGQYHLQKHPAWRSMVCQSQTWFILIIAIALVCLILYVVYRMMTAYKEPPPHALFKAAAIGFGLLTEILLIKCLLGYFSRRYRLAQQYSISVQPREVSVGPWWSSASGVKGHIPPAVGVAQGDERRQEVDDAGSCHTGHKL